MIELSDPMTNWLFPKRCVACDTDVAKQYLCASCMAFCNRYPNYNFLSSHNHGAIFYFEMVIKDLMLRAKFNKSVLATYVLMKLIRKELINSKLIIELKKFSFQAVSFVPSHWAVCALRGIELSYVFAQFLSHELNVPLVSTLKKNNYHSRQALRTSKRDRLAKIKGTFALKKAAGSYASVLLVDDIVTTGATFDEARSMLKNICDKTKCLAMAYTP